MPPSWLISTSGIMTPPTRRRTSRALLAMSTADTTPFAFPREWWWMDGAASVVVDVPKIGDKEVDNEGGASGKAAEQCCDEAQRKVTRQTKTGGHSVHRNHA